VSQISRATLDSVPVSKSALKCILKPALEATETISAREDGKFKDKREVVAGHPRMAALRTLFELHGSYAPRDPKETAQHGVETIRVDLPRPSGEFNQFIDVIPDSALSRHRPTNGAKLAIPENGKPLGDKNGQTDVCALSDLTVRLRSFFMRC